MHDIKYIRENPTDFDKAMKRRGYDESQSDIILALDEKRRAVQTELQVVQAERNEKSKKIGPLKALGEDTSEHESEVSYLKANIGELEDKNRSLGEELKNIMSGLPNIMKDAPEVPDGADEDDNVEIKVWGEPKAPNGANKAPEHYEIGENLGMMDFETATKLSGSRFVVLRGQLARLERALAQFMLDTQTDKNGYTECSPPLLVNSDAMYGTGQLPKFSEDLYSVTGTGYGAKTIVDLVSTKWLIPTAEVSLTNFVADSIIDADELPYRYTAHTPCFRSEAGSAGRDTRGMLRQHQFYKVEMVSITHPDESDAEHERMLKCAEGVLEALEIPYRTIVLCTGDTGFGARKTYDIEAWMPGQNTYREISSCSTCGDFQARRMNARFKAKGDKKTQFVHTLNGSGLAVGRCLIAVMENYYDPADGGVFVPEVLKPYMGGIDKIVKA